MIGRLAYNGVRGQYRLWRKTSPKGGPKSTPLMLLYACLPMTYLGTLIAAVQLSPWFFAWAGASAALTLLFLAASGHLGKPASGGVSGARVLAKYQPKTGITAGDMSRRAQLLRDVASLQPPEPQDLTATWQSEPPPEPAVQRERALRTAALFSVPCPVSVCLAPPELPCAMGIAVPVALVEKNPVAFCHIPRMDAAVDAGAITREDLLAQFGLAPEGAL